MDQGNFTNLSWDQDGREHGSSVVSPRGGSEEGAEQDTNGRSGGTPLQAGRNADNLDLAGVGTATLECTVTHPMKEGDGTKDAYVSYLVTTHVCLPAAMLRFILTAADYLSILRETNYLCPKTLHRFCVSL
jgi:sorting nexin-4